MKHWIVLTNCAKWDRLKKLKRNCHYDLNEIGYKWLGHGHDNRHLSAIS
jgi:hypothetical protein